MIYHQINNDYYTIRPNPDSTEYSAYIFTDTLCYRDKKNHSLFCLQENKWKPILDWFSQFTGINIIISEDLSPIKQSNILH